MSDALVESMKCMEITDEQEGVQLAERYILRFLAPLGRFLDSCDLHLALPISRCTSLPDCHGVETRKYVYDGDQDPVPETSGAIAILLVENYNECEIFQPTHYLAGRIVHDICPRDALLLRLGVWQPPIRVIGDNLLTYDIPSDPGMLKSHAAFNAYCTCIREYCDSTGFALAGSGRTLDDACSEIQAFFDSDAL